MSRRSNCQHVGTITDITSEEVKKELVEIKSKSPCDTCGITGPNLWICLEDKCGFIGCGEMGEDHSNTHAQGTKHSLMMNLTNHRVWCGTCNMEVFLFNNMPDIVSILQHRQQLMDNTFNGYPEARVSGLAEPPPRSPSPSQHSNDSVDMEIDEYDEEYDEIQEPRAAFHMVPPYIHSVYGKCLIGLKNLGNTCYMNGALQAISNCPPLTRYFLTCGAFVNCVDKKSSIAKSYMKLVQRMWCKSSVKFISPTQLNQCIRIAHPMFRGYMQQDTQEFLRCFMDSVHEELKQPIPAAEEFNRPAGVNWSEVNCQGAEVKGRGGNRIRGAVPEEEEECGEGGLCPSCARKRPISMPTGARCQACGGRKRHVKSRRNRLLYNSKEEESTATTTTTTGSPLPEEGGASSAGGQGADREPEMEVTGGGRLDRVRAEYSPSKQNPVVYEPGTKKKKLKHYRSIISDVFDGKILSCVQCLTCNRISKTKETFQDLSLPIPGKDDLARIQASQSLPSAKGITCSDNTQGWFSWIFSWLTGWVWGPNITLENCLAAFFAADDLKGDNMYSCETCKKLRNGVKIARVLELPEVLCVHLKRFRHEMFSSKISSYVVFPLEGLDMNQFLAQECQSKCHTYDLVAVICHHGNAAGGGHYTAFARNEFDLEWYEYDDMYVTKVHESRVMYSEAYVLFYQKLSEQAVRERQKVEKMINNPEFQSSLLNFYVSKQWLNRFNTFAEPGPITNYDFLCHHGGVPPSKSEAVKRMVQQLPQPIWEYLYNRYGGGPAVNHLRNCHTCQTEAEQMEMRRKEELKTFMRQKSEFLDLGTDAECTMYCVSMAWFKAWEAFIKGKEEEPPGPIDNSSITISKNGYFMLKQGSDYAQIPEDTWEFFSQAYGGGPKVVHGEPVSAAAAAAETEAASTSSNESGEDVAEPQDRDDSSLPK